jgi:adenosine kinase
MARQVKRILVCGSIAFDNIMVFRGRFKDHILPDQIHILNVAFLVPDLRREFGGCAGNIGYGLKLLGGEPLVMGTVGADAGPYLERFDALDMAREHVRVIPDALTAQAFITTDLDDNQITAFHPGAMNHAAANRIDGALDAGLAIVAPDGREGMIAHANELASAGIPFVFDPGQQLPAFAGADLLALIEAAAYVAVNDYEGRLLVDRTGRPLEELARMVDALIVTKGAAGSTIYAGGRLHEIPSVEPEAVVDPTGCGDAYRAGLLYGIAAGYDWPATGRLASLMGAIKIAHRGGQNYRPTRDEIATRYRRHFGQDIF